MNHLTITVCYATVLCRAGGVELVMGERGTFAAAAARPGPLLRFFLDVWSHGCRWISCHMKPWSMWWDGLGRLAVWTTYAQCIVLDEFAHDYIMIGILWGNLKPMCNQLYELITRVQVWTCFELAFQHRSWMHSSYTAGTVPLLIERKLMKRVYDYCSYHEPAPPLPSWLWL